MDSEARKNSLRDHVETLGLSVSTPGPRRDTLAVDNMASSKSIEYTMYCIVHVQSSPKSLAYLKSTSDAP